MEGDHSLAQMSRTLVKSDPDQVPQMSNLV